MSKQRNDIYFDLDAWKRIEQIGVCAGDARRPILSAVHVQPGLDSLTLTATDSYRLATTTIDVNCQPFDSFLLPAKTVKDIRLAVSKITELGKNPPMYLQVTKREARLAALDTEETPRFTQTIRLVEGNYPRWESIFPSDDEGLEDLTKAQLVEFIDKYGDLNGHSERTRKAELVAVAQQYKIGRAFASFNAEYVASMATSAGVKNHSHPVHFRVRGPLQPVVLTSSADRNWRGLIMPVRT